MYIQSTSFGKQTFNFRYCDRKRRRQIESQTETMIQMPYKKPEGKIQVFGSTRSSVQAAMNEIETMLALQRRRLTHFLSIPINDKGIVEQFIQFKVKTKKEHFSVRLIQNHLS